MVLKIIAAVIFYSLMVILGLYSVVMVYILLKFGKSKILGLILSAFYLLLMLSLYGAATANFSLLALPNI